MKVDWINVLLVVVIFGLVCGGVVGGYIWYKKHHITSLSGKKEGFGGGHGGHGGGGGHAGGGGGYWGGTGHPGIFPHRTGISSWYGEYGGYGGDAYGGWWGPYYDWYFLPQYYVETIPINTTSACDKACLDQYKGQIDGGTSKIRAEQSFSSCIASCPKVPYNEIGAY